MLAPCYLVHGGEPLQTEEFISAIKQLAAKEGYNSYVVFEINAQFDWEQLLNKCQSLDLFVEKSVVELRLQSDNIGKLGSTTLEGILKEPSPDLCIIIRAQKLKPQTLNSPWAQQVHKIGEIRAAKPIPIAKWAMWINQRLKQSGFMPSPDVTSYLARNYEGNLMAVAQCIKKFQAVIPPGTLALDQIKPFIDDSSRFSLFDLTDSVINGDSERTFSVFHSLKDEGVDPVLILWGITREIRHLLQLSYELQSGASLTQSAQKIGIWRDRLPSIKIALDRLTIDKLHQLLRICTSIDTKIKGINQGNVWEPLLAVCLMLAGNKILTMEELTI